ncbi:MAG: biosynthetic-type acetolactate synthase large subunit [Polyangiales bacterium]
MERTKRNGAQIIIDVLEERGVRVVAGMPGGANLPLYDALAQSRIRHVLVRHEQAAGFIAQGMARANGGVGVCFATSGPGVTNLVTALADAQMDSIPVVAITGQVPTALIGTQAFQEVDAVGMVRPIVKHAEMVRDVGELEGALRRAFELAVEGRAGPVLVDVPKDVQLAAAGVRVHRDVHGDTNGNERGIEDVHVGAHVRVHEFGSTGLDAGLLAQLTQLLAAARRPVLYVGGGVAAAGAHKALALLAQRQDLPVTCTLMGLGCFDPDAPGYLGMLGMHAAPFTNLVLQECDLLICIGARFDDRATGKLSEFCPRARTIHVDIDPREIGRLRPVELGIASDAQRFLSWFAERAPAQERPEWRARVAYLRRRHPLPCPTGAGSAFAWLDRVSEHLSPDAIVTTDVGQHQMWVAQRMRFRGPRRLLTSGGLGTMGFGLPAAIGAALATERPVLCVTGDGSLMMNIQELATLAELNSSVTILLFDNQHLGLVRQQQMLFYGERLSASAYERSVDFVTIARGFGIRATSLVTAADANERLPALLRLPGPQLIHVPIDPDEMVLPMVAPGDGNHRMIGHDATLT